MLPSGTDSDWVRYFDSESSAYYWYNQRTGESQWDNDQNQYEDYLQHEQQGNEKAHQPQVDERISLISSHQKDDGRFTSLEMVAAVNNGDKSVKKKSKSTRSGSGGSSGSHMTTNSAMHPADVDTVGNYAVALSLTNNGTANAVTAKKNRSTKKKPKSRFAIPHPDNDDELSEDDKVENESEFDMKCYQRFAMCNAVCIEQPFCVLEVFVRVAFLMFVFVVTLLYNIIFYSSEGTRLKKLYFRIVKDLLLTCAAGITLLLPCSILFVYKSLNTAQDWQLAGIPTVCGRVDCRRFATITLFGIGTQAVNVTATFQDRDFLDRWNDSILIYPRNFIADLRTFLAGRRSLESLEQGLSVDDL